MTEIDTKEGNFDCVFYKKKNKLGVCTALDKTYCRNDLNCAFVRIHDFQDIIRYKEK